MNAVFERDFVAFSSSKRFLLLLGALVFARIFPAYAGSGFGGVGTTVLEISIWVGVATVVLTAPGAFGTVLVHSRAQGSLPVLLSTPLTPLSIAAGSGAPTSAPTVGWSSPPAEIGRRGFGMPTRGNQ